MAAKENLKHTAHHTHTKKKSATNWLILGAVGLGIFLFVFVTTKYNVSENTMTKPTPSPATSQIPTQAVISDEEKKQIDQWIIDNNLNDYGDPLDTVYAGGTPLFDEKTGTYQDLYEYILKNHPDRPWQQ